MATLLLVHSPLLGPSAWEEVAERARARNRHVVLADATVAAEAGLAGAGGYVDAVVRAASGVDDRIVLVGHSGAGVFLPLIGDGLGSRLHAMVFVDAGLPPEQGEHVTDGPMQALLDAHVDDEGVLSPWLDWWSDEIVDRILPDPGVRAALRADMPRLPRSFYDEPVSVPLGWAEKPCGYLRLSAAYDADHEEARRRGWPHTTIDGHHLSIVMEADAVLDAIDTLISDLDGG